MVISSKYIWKKLSPQDSILIKGVSILFIVFHNFLHIISPLPKENEFRFKSLYANELISQLISNPADSFRILFSYFGHYPVHIFFFLTGYAFMVKYSKTAPRFLPFQRSRWRALFPAIIACGIGYVIFNGYRYGFLKILISDGPALILQGTGISNFTPDNIFHPVGPWWFISVILQVYLVLPLLLKWTHRYGSRAIVAIILFSYFCQYAIRNLTDHLFNLNLYHTFIGHLDVIGFGMLLAYIGTITVPRIVIILAFPLFLFASLYEPLWKYSDLLHIIFAVPLIRAIPLGSIIGKFFLFLGAISLYIFLCNGYLRRPIIDPAIQNSHWFTNIWTSLAFFTLATVWSLAIYLIVQKIFPKKPSNPHSQKFLTDKPSNTSQ